MPQFVESGILYLYRYKPLKRSIQGQKITPTCSVSVIAKILISDTKRGIERNDFFIVLKAEVFSRELDRISGLVGVHIDL